MSIQSKVITLIFILTASLFPADFSLIMTGSLNGHLDGCYCVSSPKGGMIKMAPFVREYRNNNPNSILLATGDILTAYMPPSLFEGEPLAPEDMKKAAYVFEAYKMLNYDAIVFGEQELANGADFFLTHAADLPYVNANAKINGTAFGKPYIIKEKDGVRVAIIGITGTNATFPSFARRVGGRSLQRLEFLEKHIALENEEAAITKAIADSKTDGADVIVLLSHRGYDEDVALAKKIDGVDIIVGGHDNVLPLQFDEKKRDYREPARVIRSQIEIGDTYVFQTGKHGLYVGLADFRYANGKLRLRDVDYRRINYGEKIRVQDKRHFKDCVVIDEEDGRFLYCKGDPIDPTVLGWLKELGVEVKEY